MGIVTRFAPSPTGYLHIGGLRTALFNYLWARKSGGKFLLRIEDTDLERNSDDAMSAIVKAFDWVNLKYDDVPYYQSKRFDIYQGYIDILLKEGKAYKCYMSKDELDILRSEQESKGERARYDGRYRDFNGIPPVGIEPVVRIKAPLSGVIRFNDGIKGAMNISANEVDDFIIARSNGVPTYNFVVAIDDALMGVNSVIRGDDHLSNTPKQIVIYEALEFELPKFYHVPMINNPSGKKLSKRDGAMDVLEYKKMGYLPDALLNFLVRLGWSNKDQEIFSMDEMLKLFDPSNINKSASAYNEDKLEWINAQYIKNRDIDKLIQELIVYGVDITKHQQKELLLNICRDRSKTLIEIRDNIKVIIDTPIIYNQKDIDSFINKESISVLKSYIKKILQINLEEIESVSKEFLKDNSLKMPNLFKPLRVALLGTSHSPSVYDVLKVLGKDEIQRRFEVFLKYIKDIDE